MATPGSIVPYNPPSVSATQVPTTGANGVTGAFNGVSGGINNIFSALNNPVAGLVGSLPQVPQYFFTVPFANNQLVLYKLVIYANQTDTTPINDGEFIFPLTPTSISKQFTNLSTYYDVRDNPNNAVSFGVQRIIDQYGVAPPTITVAGTTGFQFHSLDNYQWSGKSSFGRLITMIELYATLVTQAINSSQSVSLPRMEFWDGYTGEKFVVVPLGPQTSMMDSTRPIIQTYNLAFMVQQIIVGPTITPLSAQDPIVQFFVNTKAFLTAGFLSWWNYILGNIPGQVNIQ